MKFITLSFLLLSTLAQAGTYANPVIDDDFPDPSVLRTEDGVFYAYGTQSLSGGKLTNIQTARSTDLVHWEALPDAMPGKPWWASSTQKFWAPHIFRNGPGYALYFSAEPNERDGMCLGVATSATPLGPFVDSGKPLRCDHGFASIDPMAFVDPRTGHKLLYWGSGFEPIRVQQLSDDGLSFAPGSSPIELIQPDSHSRYEHLVEGAWVVERKGWYYLYYSGSDCCGNPVYGVSAARSRSATGPFEKLGTVLESPIDGDNPRWFAPGHNTVVRDADGRDWMLYHAIDRGNSRLREVIEGDRNVRRVLLMDPIRYEHGHPRMDSPSTGPQPAPRFQ